MVSEYYPPALRAAIVGTGGIARVHGQRICDLGSRVVAVCGRRLDAAGQLAADLGGVAEPYTDLDKLLERQRPDVLHVCSPHGLHAAHARAAIERGIHVMCEKPLGTSTDETTALCELARAAGVHAAVCLTKRSYPMVAELRARIASGAIGQLVAVRGSFLSSDSCHDRWGWGFDPATAGPSYATADLGVHWLDLVEHVTGSSVVRVDARFSTTRPVRQRDGHSVQVVLEDYVRVFLDLVDGTPVSAVFSGVSPGQPNGCAIEVDGHDGGLDWRVDRPNILVHRPPYGETRLVQRDPARLSPTAQRLAATPAGHDEGFSDAFRNAIRDVYAAIGGGPVRYPTFADGHRAALLVESVIQSARTGGAVDLAPGTGR